MGRDQTETDNRSNWNWQSSETHNKSFGHCQWGYHQTRYREEKKKKEEIKDAISQSFSAASITTWRDIVNKIKGVPAANVDSVDATPESLPIENLGIPSSTEASQKGNFNALLNIVFL